MAGRRHLYMTLKAGGRRRARGVPAENYRRPFVVIGEAAAVRAINKQEIGQDIEERLDIVQVVVVSFYSLSTVPACQDWHGLEEAGTLQVCMSANYARSYDDGRTIFESAGGRGSASVPRKA